MDRLTDSPCILQDFIPSGAAALLPLNLNHTLLKQGTDTADHLLPLGCYFLLPLVTAFSKQHQEHVSNRPLGAIGAHIFRGETDKIIAKKSMPPEEAEYMRTVELAGIGQSVCVFKNTELFCQATTD